MPPLPDRLLAYSHHLPGGSNPPTPIDGYPFNGSKKPNEKLGAADDGARRRLEYVGDGGVDGGVNGGGVVDGGGGMGMVMRKESDADSWDETDQLDNPVPQPLSRRLQEWFVSRKVWLLGFFVFAVGNGGDFIALGITKQSIVTLVTPNHKP